MLLGMLAFTSAPVAAQTGSPGGVQMTFGLSQRLEYDDNLALNVTSAGNTFLSTTRLSFGLSTETRTEKLTFSASTALRGVAGSAPTNNTFVIDDPRFDLAYSRNVGASALTLGANYRQSEVQFLRPLTDFLDANGNIVLPDDLSDLTGTGVRTEYGLNGSLQFGVNAPLGVTLNAGLAGLGYDRVTNPALTDSQRINIGTTFRLRLDPTTNGTVKLGFGEFKDLAANTSRYTRSLDVGLSRQLTNGNIAANLTASNSIAGTRLGFSVSRDIPLPSGSLSASLGITRPAGAKTGLTGSLDWSQTLKAGSISARLSRAVTVSSKDIEQLTTSVTLNYNQTLSANSSMSFSLGYALTDPSGATNNTANTTLGASYRRALTPDWSLDVGYNYRLRDSDVIGSANSNSVFMALQRSFNIRP